MTYTYGWGSFRYYTHAGMSTQRWQRDEGTQWDESRPSTPVHTLQCIHIYTAHTVCLTARPEGWKGTGTGDNPITTGVTRRPFIKCYPGCINLILTPLLNAVARMGNLLWLAAQRFILRKWLVNAAVAMTTDRNQRIILGWQNLIHTYTYLHNTCMNVK